MKTLQNHSFGQTFFALAPRLFCVAITSISLAAQAYSPPASGLVSWWRAENNALDSAGANHGTGVNTLTYGSGLSGSSFALDGMGGHVQVPASSSLNVGAGNGFTVGMWIKPSSFNLQDLIEWNNGAGFIGVHMTLNVPNLGGGEGSLWANLVDTSGGDHQLSSTTGLISTNAFQHVALNYDKLTGRAKLYINGSSVASANLGTFTPQTSSDAFFGIRPSGPFTGIWYGGLMDEVTLYNRALTDGEVVTLATVPEPATGALMVIAAVCIVARRRQA
jgi:hypothetical protein